MMVIFLVGLVSMILMRTLRKDYARYSKEDDIDEMVRVLCGTCWCVLQVSKREARVYNMEVSKREARVYNMEV